MSLRALPLLVFPALLAGRGGGEARRRQYFRAILVHIFIKDVVVAASGPPGGAGCGTGVLSLNPAEVFLLIGTEDGGPVGRGVGKA